VIGKNRVVITGVGVLAANGIGKEAFWNSLLAGESGIGPVTLFDASDLPCRIAGEVSDFDPANYFEPKLKAKRWGRFTQLALAAAQHAFDDASLSSDFLQSISRIPIILGVSTSSMDVAARKSNSYNTVVGIPNAASSAMTYLYNLNSRIQTITNGCASSLDAIGEAFSLIASGRSDIAITGGADSCMVHYVFDCMSKSRKLALGNDNPASACKPFDLTRTGGVAAEGGAILILESLEHAQDRGIKPYCEVFGAASAADPNTPVVAAGLADSMTHALDNAGVGCADIDYINAHGPGDQSVDVEETNSIKNVFQERAFSIPVSSIKGATGSPMGTGGAMQVIATALAIQNGVIPPTTNYKTPDPDCDLDYVPRNPRQLNINYALVNSHGFGRSNCSVVLGGVS